VRPWASFLLKRSVGSEIAADFTAIQGRFTGITINTARAVRQAERDSTIKTASLPSSKALTAHQPDCDQPNDGRSNTDDPQRRFGRFHNALHRLFGMGRKRGKHQTLDNEDQGKRGQKIVHTGRAAFYLGAEAGGDAPSAAGAASLPDGSLK
jgi:hypothetical protein